MSNQAEQKFLNQAESKIGSQFGQGGNQGGSSSSGGASGGSSGGSSGQQDYLDKAVQWGEQRGLGHTLDPSTTEKISDGIRSGFKSLTGKDIPVADKQ